MTGDRAQVGSVDYFGLTIVVFGVVYAGIAVVDGAYRSAAIFGGIAIALGLVLWRMRVKYAPA